MGSFPHAAPSLPGSELWFATMREGGWEVDPIASSAVSSLQCCHERQLYSDDNSPGPDRLPRSGKEHSCHGSVQRCSWRRLHRLCTTGCSDARNPTGNPTTGHYHDNAGDWVPGWNSTGSQRKYVAAEWISRRRSQWPGTKRMAREQPATKQRCHHLIGDKSNCVEYSWR